MIRINVVCIGKIKEKYIKEGIAEFSTKFGEYDKNENVDGEFDESNFDPLNDDENEFFENEEEVDDEDLSEFLDDFLDDENE